MTESKVFATATIIQRLLRMENGIRKAARIFLFLDRAQAVEILYELPPALIAAIAREMAILRAQIQDFEAERRALETELGAASALIDLSPPKLDAATPFRFLDQLSESQQRTFASGADLELLAVVVTNASPDVAFNMTTALTTRFQRKELTEAMTRLSRSDVDWGAVAKKHAASVQLLRASVATRRESGSRSAITQASKRRSATRVDDLALKGDGPASVAEALTQVLDMGGVALLQSALATLPDDLIAGGLAAASSAEGDLLRANLSRNRQQEVAAILERLALDEKFDHAAAQRQMRILIGRLSKAGGGK